MFTINMHKYVYKTILCCYCLINKKVSCAICILQFVFVLRSKRNFALLSYNQIVRATKHINCAL